MKRLVFAVLAVLVFVGPAMAADKEWIEGQSGCYRYRLQENDILVVDLATQLTTDKEGVARNSKEVEKECNELGKSIHGRLMKIAFISAAIIAPRQIAVQVYGYPPNPWKDGLNQVLDEFDQVLCGKAKKK
jgi:hypothetical protein